MSPYSEIKNKVMLISEYGDFSKEIVSKKLFHDYFNFLDTANH